MIRQTPCPLYPLLASLALILVSGTAFALPALSISSPGSDGVFVLRGDQMDGVAGLDLSIGYDSGTLGNPRVTMGRMLQGMMSAANPGNPIRIAVVGTRALTGSGVIATIAFERSGSSPGVVSVLTGTLIDNGGRKVAMAQPVIANPSTVVAAAGGQEGASRTGEANDSASGAAPVTIAIPHPVMVGGTVTMPGEERGGQQTSTGGDAVAAADPVPTVPTAPAAKRKLRTRLAQYEGEEPPLEREDTLPTPEDERGPAPEAIPAQPESQLSPPVQVTSVLTRFKEYKGERTPAYLVALFRSAPGLPYLQVPPVAIADGKATVTLVINMTTGKETPRFTFSGCSYVSHNRNETGAWEIQARPERDVVEASVTMLYDGLSQEFPLTVAPRVPLLPGRARPVKEADFERFLKERGSAGRPRFDLNRDGRRDYIDDYIFAANYLAQTSQQKR